MIAELGQYQHKLETMARRLKQLHAGTTAAAAHTAFMLQWCDDLSAFAESGAFGEALYDALENTRAAVQAAHIDLMDTEFALESAQLRAHNTGRMLAAIITRMTEEGHEAQ